MKLFVVAFLVLGMLSNSVLAIAEGPVPFRAFMQTAGAQPTVSPIANDKDKSTAVSSNPAHPPHMTREGKIMTGVGIGLVASGALIIAGTGIMHDWASTSRKAALYAGGGGLAATGTILIVLGNRRRAAQ